ALSNLQQTVMSMQLQSTFLPHTTASSDSTVVTATASTLTPTGTYKVSVQQLAQGATVYSSQSLSSDPNWAQNTQLSSVGYSTGLTLTVNGESIAFSGTNTIADVLSELTADPRTGVAAFYDASTGRVVVQTTATGGQAKIKVDSQTQQFFSNVLGIQAAPSMTSAPIGPSGLATSGTIEVNGQKIQLTAGMSASQVAAAINAVTSQTGVTATANGDGTITLAGTDGNGNMLLSAISVDDPSNLLGLPSYATLGLDPASVAQDAKYSVNGYSSTSSTNQVNYNGLSLNLLSTTPPGGSVTVTVSPDVDTVVNTIENFVQQYNQALQLMQGLYNEQRNYDYPPLTTTQAAQMTQTQIDLWNQKAQSGVLSNDPLLGSIMDTLENDMQLTVSGQTPSVVNGQSQTLNSLAAIGITPIDPLTGPASGAIAPGVTTTGWNTYGLLQINVDQLRAAVQADPQAVMRLFTNNPSLPGAVPGMGTGIAVQLNNDLQNLTDQLTQEAGSNPNINSLVVTKLSNGQAAAGAGLLPATPIDPNGDFSSLFSLDPMDVSFLGQQISGMDNQAEDMQQQIADLRQRYQNEFAQMENMLAQLSTQQSFLLSAFAGSSSGG
ncbi:MAG: flagellar filament capping protein FliD, partial [Thermoflavifilum sp.]|nr:flagellar filament capping protein FliD [Thermoflavifilum sp.]MCL6515082.1 flagellar filament capping protein FliD [Alicyclobacillus sp.]